MQRVYKDMSEEEKNHLRGRRATYSFLHLHSKRPDPDPLTPRKCLGFKTPAELFMAQLLHFKL